MQEMLDFLRSFKPLTKADAVDTDNNVFKLHSKITVVLLVVFSVLVTSKQYFGDPIDCVYESGGDKQVIETYCWIFGTYTVKKSLKEESLTLGAAAYPGVAPDPVKHAEKVFRPNQDDEIITQKYYQFVCIVFGLQALLFYIPRYLWKTWEGGRIALLVEDLGGPLVPEYWTRERREALMLYFLSYKYSYHHNIYAYRFLFCEAVNLLNVLMQIILMDQFLGGQFLDYGLAVASFSGQDLNPMASAFPKMTKCNFFIFGASGQIQKRDALCILPLNILNEKLFVLLWFWFMFLAFVSILNLFYRLTVMCIPQVRMYLLMAQARYISKRNCQVIVEKFNFGDWFVLYQVGKNLNPIIHKELVTEIGMSIRCKEDVNKF